MTDSPTSIFICNCGNETNRPTEMGAPDGWTIVKHTGGKSAYCPDCSRTMDFSAHTSGAPVQTPSVAATDTPFMRRGLWQVELGVATDKGLVNSTITVTAVGVIAALNMVLKMTKVELPDRLISAIVCPAPLSLSLASAERKAA